MATKWFQKVSKNENQSWMIVLVAEAQQAKRSNSLRRTHSRSSSYFAVKSTIDRVRGDFNTGNINHCVRLDYVRFGTPDAEGWNEFLKCLEWAVLSSLDSRFLQLSEQIRSIKLFDSSIFSDYLLFFLQKERLAASFFDLVLYRESLEQCEDMFSTLSKIISAIDGKKENISKYLGEGSDAQPDLKDFNSSFLILGSRYNTLHNLLADGDFTLFHFTLFLLSKIILLNLKISDYEKAFSTLQQALLFLTSSFFNEFVQNNLEIIAAFNYDCYTLLFKKITEAIHNNDTPIPLCCAKILLYARRQLTRMARWNNLIDDSSPLLWREPSFPLIEHHDNSLLDNRFQKLSETISSTSSFLSEYYRLSSEALSIFKAYKNRYSFVNTACDTGLAQYLLEDYENAYASLKNVDVQTAWSNDPLEEKWSKFYVDLLEKLEKFDEALEFASAISKGKVSIYNKNKILELSKKTAKSKVWNLDDFFTIEIPHMMAVVPHDDGINLSFMCESKVFDLESVDSVTCNYVLSSSKNPMNLLFTLHNSITDGKLNVHCNVSDPTFYMFINNGNRILFLEDII